MRIFSLISLFTLGLFYAGIAQVDVLNTRANPKTFIFDDDKHTVHGYIYNQLKEKTSCCGNDAIYLEVKFDESGSVTSAKTLTGKNECFKQSVIDIVSSVRWDATDVKGSKTIYFEVKPIVPCSGGPSENVYKKIPRIGGGDLVSNNTGAPKTVEVSTEVAVKEQPKEQPKEVVVVKEQPKEVVKEEPIVSNSKNNGGDEDGFLSDDTPVEEPVKPVKETVKPVKETVKPVATVDPTPKETVKSQPTQPIAKTTRVSPGSIPPQAKLDYVSQGERAPDPSHKDSHLNDKVTTVSNPEISDESSFGVQMRSSLRKAGYCGLANALVEVEVDRYGSVVNSRIMYANSDQVKEILPGIIKGLKFKAQGANDLKSFYSYYQIKTEIVCGAKPQFNLQDVPAVIKSPDGQP
jgi:hypothetical protein